MTFFPTLGVLSVLSANPFRTGKSTRAKLAKVKGIKDDQIAQLAVEWAFAPDKELHDQRSDQ